MRMARNASAIACARRRSPTASSAAKPVRSNSASPASTNTAGTPEARVFPMIAAVFPRPPRIASLHPHGAICPRRSAVTNTTKRVAAGEPGLAGPGAFPDPERVQAASSVAAMKAERSCKVPSAEGRDPLPSPPGRTRVVDRPRPELV